MITVVRPYIALMRLDRPIGTFLLLWPTLIALWLASNGAPKLTTLIVFIIGVILMRSAGCVINDYADREFDVHVIRTQQRPLAAQIITAKNALLLYATLIFIGAALVLQLSLNTIGLATVAVLLASIYPFAKRFTNYPQVILGLAFAWSIPMAYMEVTQQLTMETWLLFGSTIMWVVAYDTQYAMADKADDLKVGIKSTAIAFGQFDRLIIFILQICALIGFSYIGLRRGFNVWYYACISIAGGLVGYQQVLIKDRNPKKCFAAFLNNNYFGAIIYIGTFLG